MLEPQFVDEYSDCIEDMWALVDSRVPHTTAPLRGTEKYAMRINALLEECTIPVLSMATTLASIIEMVDGVEFSKQDIALMRVALLNEVICQQIMAFREVELCDLADRDMELANAMSRLIAKENEDGQEGQDRALLP